MMMRPSWFHRRETFYYFLLLLALIHGFTLLMKLRVAEKSSVVPTVKRTQPIRVQMNRGPLERFRTKQQIVQSEDGGEKKKLDDARLSDKDRTFDRETVARKVDIFKQGAKSAGGGGAPAKPKKQLKLSDLGGVSGAPHPLEVAAQDYTKKKKGPFKGDGQGNHPNRTVSSTNDHVEDVPLGDMTHLNTAEYKYYGFYHRIRQKLEQYWGRSIQEKAELIAKAGRRVASTEEFVTALEITLNHLGEIIAIRLIDTSGVKELDDAAVESFNEAGPFPNPPQGLVKNGRVTIEWGFVVNT